MRHVPADIPPGPMSREAFLAWAEQQPRGRYERLDGRIIAMAPERASHVRVKQHAWQALHAATKEKPCDCEALVDGLSIAIGEHSDFQPDCLVNCGPLIEGDVMVATNPVVVVEVVSPSSRSIDTVTKLKGYFSVPSVRHYLIFVPNQRLVVHHARQSADRIDTRLVSGGRLELDPPGITLNVDAVFQAAGL